MRRGTGIPRSLASVASDQHSAGLFRSCRLVSVIADVSARPAASLPVVVLVKKPSRLFTLPEDTLVLPGHGLDTTIGTERPHLDEWIERCW